MDIRKCFDKMSYIETANDLCNAGVAHSASPSTFTLFVTKIAN